MPELSLLNMEGSLAKCKYCGSIANAGQPCKKSPTTYHVIDNGNRKCIYCGATASVGQPCKKSPTKHHINGS